MNNTIDLYAGRNEFIEYKNLKFVSYDDEQEYLNVFEQVNKARKHFFGARQLGCVIIFDNKEAGAFFQELYNLKKFTIYRGYNQKIKHNGISWTTDLTVPELFARRHLGDNDTVPSILKATCAIKDVLVLSEHEREIVINPTNLKNIQSLEMAAA